MVRTARKPKQPDGFDLKVSAYPDENLRCRDTGHSWKPLTAKRITGGDIQRVLVCANCEAKRNQTLDRMGYIVSTSYAYKVGYQLPGIGRLTSAHRAVLRLASIGRNLIE